MFLLTEWTLVGNGVEIMQSIVETLMKELSSGNNLSAISKSVGGDDTAVKSALDMGLPLVLGSMANTASKPGGTEMLTKMLAQTGGSNPMDNLSSFLGNPAAAGGSGMVNTLFGSQMGTVQNAISQKTGLPAAAVAKVMEIATPLIVGYVGKMFIQQKMDTTSLTSLLGDQSKMALQSSSDADSVARQLLAAQTGGGASGILKKILGK